MESLYRYRARSMQAIDEMTERLIAALEAKGELANTYVFSASDNGFHMGEHGLTQGKVSPYEEDGRVPLLVRGPGVPASQTRDRFVLNNDFAPTFADLAGVVPSSFVDGRSWRYSTAISPTILRSTTPSLWRAGATSRVRFEFPRAHLSLKGCSGEECRTAEEAP